MKLKKEKNLKNLYCHKMGMRKNTTLMTGVMIISEYYKKFVSGLRNS